jgi:uroporphyrinogen decarboxylase
MTTPSPGLGPAKRALSKSRAIQQDGTAWSISVVKQWALSDPDGFQPLMDVLTAAVAQFLDRQIEAGAEAVQLFDTWAGILPDTPFERWCVKPAAAIIAALKVKYPDVPVIAFPRGAGLAYDGFAEATGADRIGLDVTVPLGWAAQKVQRGLGRCVQGNLDPQLLVVGGPALYAETDRILRALSGGPFVFNLGHGIVKTTPPEHVTVLSMTRSAPRLLTSSTCGAPQTAVTLAPRLFTSWTAAEPMAPVAPLTRTCCPPRIFAARIYDSA